LVRNPFSRVVSLYEYLKKTGRIHSQTGFRSFCGLLSDGAFKEIGLYNSEGLSQCNPQNLWITDKEGNRLVDFVGRIENADSDFQDILINLGIQGQLPFLNRTPRAQTANYYNTETTDLVVKAYEVDFDTFGYSKFLPRD